MKRLRSDLNDTTEDTANYEGSILSGFQPAAEGAEPAAKDVEGAPPASAPETMKGGSTDSTTGRIGGLSMTEEVAPAATNDVAIGNGNGSGAAGSLSTQSPPAKRFKPARAAAAVEIAATVTAAAGEKELRETLAKQNRLLADMAKELESLRRERSLAGEGVGVAMNGGGGGGAGVGTAGEGSAVLPVSRDATR